MTHGTLAGYNYHGCRCKDCRAAINRYKKDRYHGVRRQDIWDLKDAPCMDCGIKYNPWQMQFDHREGEVKIEKVSRMTSRSFEKVLEEIAKCDLVCSNCHADRTYKRKIASKERSTLSEKIEEVRDTQSCEA